MTSALPGIIAGFKGGRGPAVMLARYNTQVAANRSAVNATKSMPPMPPMMPMMR